MPFIKAMLKVFDRFDPKGKDISIPRTVMMLLFGDSDVSSTEDDRRFVT